MEVPDPISSTNTDGPHPPASLPDTAASPGTHPPRGRYLFLLSLTALGVIYGDIGTSPLYALRECFHGPHGILATQANVLGVLSLVFWALVIVIAIKYLGFILRANNRGEGGILALTTLVTPMRAATRGGSLALILLGLFGAALLYGDGVITPAISVLSAVEGLSIATPMFDRWVLPITVAILIGLFMIQRRGTASIGKIFGPITTLWFLVLAVLGLWHVAQEPTVLLAVNPWHGALFFDRNGLAGFLVLGSVFLVVTGGEALYADMGHFGLRPIRLTWFWLVMPALVLNYFGQGALLLRDPASFENPFYHMVPSWALYPMVALATLATVIASQAVISGAFSLTRQAIQLGYCPRMTIKHTSSREIGQIYIPFVNWALLLGCIWLVLEFRSSSRLAAAYGIAVTSTMAITTILFFMVARRRWKWGLPAALALSVTFLVIDLAFLGANLAKILQGGWFPLALALGVFVLLTTWKTGRRVLARRLAPNSVPMERFLQQLAQDPPVRVSGTAVYMNSNPEGAPRALLHNLKHNRVLHEHTAILTVETQEVPHVPETERVQTECFAGGICRILVRYGFMEDPDVPGVLRSLRLPGMDLDPERATFFLSHERIIPSAHPGMMIWRERLFGWMSRNALDATTYFGLPPNRVVELGAQVEI